MYRAMQPEQSFDVAPTKHDGNVVELPPAQVHASRWHAITVVHVAGTLAVESGLLDGALHSSSSGMTVGGAVGTTTGGDGGADGGADGGGGSGAGGVGVGGAGAGAGAGAGVGSGSGAGVDSTRSSRLSYEHAAVTALVSVAHVLFVAELFELVPFQFQYV